MKNKNPEGTDNFEFNLASEFKGYNSAVDPTNTIKGLLTKGSYNVYRKISGTIANRPGRKQYDAVDDTLAKVDSEHIWNTSLESHLPIRVSNGQLSVLSDITGSKVWYNLLSTSATRWVFDSWWDASTKKDKLIGVNGTSNLYVWEGGIGLISSTTVNTIVLTADALLSGFTTSGSVLINGNTYTYSGISGSTLTGVGTDPTGEANGSAVIATVTTTATTPASGFNNDFIKIINNQLYVGSYTSRQVYISKNTSYTDYTKSTPRATGEGDIVTMDDVGKGITVRQGKAHIFSGTSYLYIVSFNQITIGSSLSEQTIVDKIELGNLISAQGHEFIDTLSDNIIYLDQANQLRGYGTYRNLFKDKSALLSQPVQNELAGVDFTNGQVKVVSDRRGDIVYITAPNSGTTYMYQERTALDSVGNIISERLWQPPFIWGLSRIDSLNGQVVGFSNSNPQMYTLWETEQWHDDAPDGQVAYTCVMLVSYQNGGRRQGKINFDKFYIEGYAANGSELYGGIYYDYQGYSGLQSPILNTPESPFPTFYTGAIPPSLGDYSLGDNPLGDGLLQDEQFLLAKFRVLASVQQNDCFEYALMVYSSNADARWEVLCLGVNETLAFAQAVEIMK